MEFIWDATDSQPYNLSVFIHRYASRCLMVEFTEPPLQMTIAEYMGLVELWTACSSCAGLCISLGKKFFHQGVEEVDQMILPEFLSDVTGSISPRVVPSYSVLYWFAHQVSFLLTIACPHILSTAFLACV